MGWSFRRSKSFGLFCLNFSKSGIGVSVGAPGARVGVNSKGKKNLRGGIPGTGLYYQSSLPDAQHVHSGGAPQSTTSVSPLVILIVVFVVGVMIYSMSSSTQAVTSAPVTPVPQVVAPVTAPLATRHVVKKHTRKHTISSSSEQRRQSRTKLRRSDQQVRRGLVIFRLERDVK